VRRAFGLRLSSAKKPVMSPDASRASMVTETPLDSATILCGTIERDTTSAAICAVQSPRRRWLKGVTM